jgi:hypothetical protein
MVCTFPFLPLQLSLKIGRAAVSCQYYPRRFAGRTMPALIDQEYCTIDTATTTLDVYYGTPRLCLCDRILSLFYLSVFVLVEWAAKSAPRGRS